MDLRAKEQELDFLRIKLRPPADIVSLPSEIALSRSDLGLYRPFFEKRREVEQLRSFRERVVSKMPSP